MTMYKIPLSSILETPRCIIRVSDNASIPFDPANTDYANFKADILADKAELQDADGNTMTPEQAKAYIEELP